MSKKTNIPKYWTFDAVADTFDHHVREQLPWYDLATKAVADIVQNYLPEGGTVYDIGASNGNIGRAIADTVVARSASLIAIEKNPAMLATYDCPIGTFIGADVLDHQFSSFDVCVSFLTMMFLPISRRSELLVTLRSLVRKGGAIVILEKFEGTGGWYTDRVLHRLSLSAKLSEGADPSEIIAKELSLSGAQRPLRAGEIDGVEFFRYGEFAGYIIEG